MWGTYLTFSVELLVVFLPGRKTFKWETAQSNNVKIHGTTPNLVIILYAEKKTDCDCR